MRSARATVVMVFVMLTASCGSDFPGQPPWGSISGKLVYAGEIQKTLSEPAAGVYAFAAWPPEGLPHASRLFRYPDFSEGFLAYELANLDPYTYYVFGMIVDLDQPISLEMDLSDPTALPPAIGAYPTLLTFEQEPVEVLAGQPTSDIDIDLHELR